jgi:pilus assembly protein Flp/PilA
MLSLIGKFIADERGATSIEYALLASGISLAIITAVGNLGARVNASYVSIGAAIQ